ncbi:MAG TPA: amidase [Bryobacteraceae bacterium]|nr:amidase [Bryobacteraceae bacterium]
MDRRQFLQGALLALPAARSASAQFLDLEEITLADLEQGFRGGRFTSRAVTQWYLSRITSLDRGGPRVNAVIELNPDALEIAETLDRERASKGPRGPLHGVPVLIKDNIDTADRMMTTAGSLALMGSIAARDSFVAARLRAAGAVILGKTNLSEWANFRSTHSVSGWSGRGGLTHNPYALDRNPSGSSSGSGAGTAANFCAVAVGTETDGSVTAPSSVNCLVGIKPTVGLISRAGIIPISQSQDTAGPMARTVRDAAILLSALAGADPRDPATSANAGKAQADYTTFLVPGGLKGARLGVERKFFGGNAATDRIIEECLALMKREGAELIDPAVLASHGTYDDDEFQVLLYEFKAGVNAYLAGLSSKTRARSLADLIAFNREHRKEEMPYFEQETFEKAQEKGPLTERAYLDARARCVKLSREEGIDGLVAQHKLDAIVAPTMPPAPLNDLVLGDANWPSCTTPAAVAGYPHITVPAGFVHGLPVGISFFGPAWSEPVLLKLAYAFEQASKVRKPPRFAATANLGV